MTRLRNIAIVCVILGWCTPYFIWDLACVAAAPKTRGLPSVTLDSAVYAARDLPRINRVLDDFDEQCVARGINLMAPGYKVELRLIKEAR